MAEHIKYDPKKKDIRSLIVNVFPALALILLSVQHPAQNSSPVVPLEAPREGKIHPGDRPLVIPQSRGGSDHSRSRHGNQAR